MARTLISTSETPEEAEARRRATTAFRIKVLIGVSVVVLGARFLIKDPERKGPVDYSKVQVKIVPGMLDTMPASTRAQLDPKLVAKMVLVDEMARRGEYGKPDAKKESSTAGTYRPMDAPTEADVEAEAYKEQVFAYARRRRIEAERQARVEVGRDIRRTVLVRFASGGFVHAERAEKRASETFIRLDRTIEADLPNVLVASVKSDSLDWNEPVPAGQVKLTPARGITVILNRDTASRVTIEKSPIDEI